MATWLVVLAGGLYAAGWAAAWVHLARPSLALLPWVPRLMTVGAVLHGAGIAVRVVEMGSLPATSGMDSLSFLSLLLAITFLVYARRYPVAAVGAFAGPLACLTLAASVLFGTGSNEVPEALKTGYFFLHVTLAFMGDAFLALAAAAACAYVVQERNLRLKKLASAGMKLPNLQLADHLAYRCVTLGFLFMSLGMVAGIIYSKHAWHAYWSWDPRQTWSLATWFAYLGLLHARLTSGWHGRRWAWLTMGAFTMVVSASVVLDAFQWGRHAGTYDARPTAVGEP